MFKKVCLAVALATCSTVSFANGAPYVGGSLGVIDTTSTTPGVFRGVPATVFGGYGASINRNIYLGGEVLATLGTFNITNATTAIGGLKTSYGYGASIIPGIYVSESSMVFGRVGVVRSRFSDLSETVTGGQVGLGMQTTVSQNWDLRGEYDYTKYSSVHNLNPQTDAFNLGLIYKID